MCNVWLDCDEFSSAVWMKIESILWGLWLIYSYVRIFFNLTFQKWLQGSSTTWISMYNQNRQEHWSDDIVDSQGHHDVLPPHIRHWLVPGAVYIFSEVHQSSRCSSNFIVFCQLTDTSLILCHSLFQINISFPPFRSHAHFFHSIWQLGKVIFQPGCDVRDFVYIFAASVEIPVQSII